MIFKKAPDIQKRLTAIVKKLQMAHIRSNHIVAFRSYGSVSGAYARIWSLPTIWQQALNVEAHYCIEVLTERFDRENFEEQTKILIHELLHIPSTFSGALLPHRGRGKKRIDRRTVEKHFKVLKNNF